MNKSLAITMFAGAVSANLGANGYSRGIPPTTQNCNSHPMVSTSASDYAAQNIAWGLVVDREFGGCRCADEDEMEFGPNPVNYEDNMWSCRCLNTDLYVSQPEGLYKCWNPANNLENAGVVASQLWANFPNNKSHVTNNLNGACNTAAGVAPAITGVSRLNDANGKKCGVISECQTAAVTQQRTRWNEEAARALRTKESARVLSNKSLLPEAEMDHARTLRIKMTKENRMRARVQVASLAMKYRAVKNAMLAGSLDK